MSHNALYDVIYAIAVSSAIAIVLVVFFSYVFPAMREIL